MKFLALPLFRSQQTAILISTESWLSGGIKKLPKKKRVKGLFLMAFPVVYQKPAIALGSKKPGP